MELSLDADPKARPPLAAGNNARVQRYRAKHRRIDYVPAADAFEIIKTCLDRKLDNCMAGVIDQLIRRGYKTFPEAEVEAPPSGTARAGS